MRIRRIQRRAQGGGTVFAASAIASMQGASDLTAE
jgi:hypothetical protein